MDAGYSGERFANQVKRKKHINNTGISQHQIKAIARYTLPDILTFYESIEGPREFAEWKKR